MPDPLPIWPTDAQAGAVDATGDHPTLTFYRARGGVSGATVMVLPGGGYSSLAAHEADPIALWLNEQGFHAAVLRYRRGRDWPHPVPAQDAQRGVRLLRTNAARWGVDADAVGVLGFSAGGHLASTLAVHYDDFHCAADDLAGHVSARPDAAVLCYPVIDLAGSAAHGGARTHLLGPDPAGDVADLLSTHRHVTPETCPTFLWHCGDDPTVPAENSLLFAAACREQGVPVELHVYENGGGRHGYGLALDHPIVGTWRALCVAFLRRHLEGAVAV